MTSSNAATAVPVGVIGTGRMGRLHVKTYAAMKGVTLVGVYDATPTAADAAAKEFGTTAFTDLGALLAQVKAVTIATPTHFHAAAAEACFTHNVACLIEKPLARDGVECRKIARRAAEAGVVVQVGHIERFNPAVRALMKLGLKPRFIEATRVSPMTFRSLDVGVVLDMMIHDLDVVLKLAGSPLAKVEAVGTSVLGGPEDACNARLTFANGCVASVSASRVALTTQRTLRAYSPEAFVSLDYGARAGTVARVDQNVPGLRDVAARVRGGEITDLSQLRYAEMIRLEPLEIDAKDPLTAQAESFITAVRNGGATEVTVEDGLAAVDAAERIVAAMPKLSLGT